MNVSIDSSIPLSVPPLARSMFGKPTERKTSPVESTSAVTNFTAESPSVWPGVGNDVHRLAVHHERERLVEEERRQRAGRRGRRHLAGWRPATRLHQAHPVRLRHDSVAPIFAKFSFTPCGRRARGY